MKSRVILLVFMVVLSHCYEDNVNNPLPEPNYTGQYQSVPYNTTHSDPTVVLLLDQEGNEVSGTGYWNGLTFSFSGTIISKHILIRFDLTETNYGNLKGDIDTYAGEDKSLAGGYNLYNTYNVFSGAIRFKLVGN
jgi:hypothetical protein